MHRLNVVLGAVIISLGVLLSGSQNIIASGPDDEFPNYQLSFSGYTWDVDSYSFTTNIQPIQDIQWPESIFVDSEGRLHLTISYRDGKWWSTEAVNTKSFGYGTYVFHLASRVDMLDPSAVLATFIWNKNPPSGQQEEIDIEFSSWGTLNNFNNSQYAVQPTTSTGNVIDFNSTLTSNRTTQMIVWEPTYIFFKSEEAGGREIMSWLYTGKDIPSPDGERVVISYWVYPIGQITNTSEFIIEGFEFYPKG